MIIKVKTLVFCENFLSTETFTLCSLAVCTFGIHPFPLILTVRSMHISISKLIYSSAFGVQ